MDINRICPYCMRESLTDGKSFCPLCGKNRNELPEVQHQLKPYTILQGKYLVGTVMGEGGFGITYIGVDLNLEIRLAIKEFYPNGYATRESNSTTDLTLYDGSNRAAIEKWRDSFIKEARSLAKCSDLPGVVGVRDYFQENETAYIAMDYVEGQTLKSYVASQGGKVSAEWLLPKIEPVITSLDQVHKHGLIHRDISPDNIMLQTNGQMKLLDFGAARDYTSGGEKSLSILLKPGFAPEEQYRSKGNQGPWSDVYAMAGTIYKCLTGETPPEAMERMRNDELKSFSAMGVQVSPGVESAILNALAVFAENRTQSMAAFHEQLYGQGVPVTPTSMSTTGVVNAGMSTDADMSTTGATVGANTSDITKEKPNSGLSSIKERVLAVWKSIIADEKKKKTTIIALSGTLALLVVIIVGVIVSSNIKNTKAELAAKEEELLAAEAEASAAAEAAEEEKQRLVKEAEEAGKKAAEEALAQAAKEAPAVEQPTQMQPEEVDEIESMIASTSAPYEDFSNVINPAEFVNYRSSVGSGYFSIYYPLGLYQTASHEYDLGGDLYGDLLEKVTFFGANGSYLIYYNYKRTDGDSMEAKGDFISSSEGSHLVEATVQTPKCPDGMKKYAIYGYDKDISTLSVYELIAIDNDYVCIMKIGNNAATGSNAEKYSDWSLISYYNECLYRMAGFCRYDGTYRSYDEFYEVAKEW